MITKLNSKENQNAVSDTDNLKFDCSFSNKAIKDNAVTMLVFIVPAILFSIYLCIVSRVWGGLIALLIPIATIAVGIAYLKRLVKESYLEITTDNILKCHFKGHRVMSYPIKEIKTIKEATIKEAEKEFARFPVVLNTKGEEYYSENGVLITFNRSWIKSVFPVYFNPKNVEGFIAVISQRMKN